MALLSMSAASVVAQGRYLYYAFNPNKKWNHNHVFSTAKGGQRPKHGHLTDTFPNRYRIAKTYLKKENFVGRDQWGKDFYAELRPDGQQNWAIVKEGKLISGGVNPIPKDHRAIYGLYKPGK